MADPNCSRLASLDHSIPHRQVLDQGREQMHLRDWPIRQHTIQHHRPYYRTLANGAAPKMQYTAFTLPGNGQFEWTCSPQGCLGVPASFQHLMETVVRGISNVIVYIDDLLLYSKNQTLALGAVGSNVEAPRPKWD